MDGGRVVTAHSFGPASFLSSSDLRLPAILTAGTNLNWRLFSWTGKAGNVVPFLTSALTPVWDPFPGSGFPRMPVNFAQGTGFSGFLVVSEV